MGNYQDNNTPRLKLISYNTKTSPINGPTKIYPVNTENVKIRKRVNTNKYYMGVEDVEDVYKTTNTVYI